MRLPGESAMGWVILDGVLYLMLHLQTTFANVINSWQSEIGTALLSPPHPSTAQPERRE